MSDTQAAIFFGHGSPMNALLKNPYTEAWERIGRKGKRPKAILSISAHWFVPETGVDIGTAPKTIHDFGPLAARTLPGAVSGAGRSSPGPAGSAPAGSAAGGAGSFLGARPRDMVRAAGDLYPEADIPVVQLSIDESKPAAFHSEIGKRLAPLRDEGVLIVGSGNLVHNLHAYRWGRHTAEPFDWAVQFEALVKEAILAGEYRPVDRIRGSGRRCAAIGSDAGALLAASLCRGNPTGRGIDRVSGGRGGWRLDFHAGGRGGRRARAISGSGSSTVAGKGEQLPCYGLLLVTHGWLHMQELAPSLESSRVSSLVSSRVSPGRVEIPVVSSLTPEELNRLAWMPSRAQRLCGRVSRPIWRTFCCAAQWQPLG